MGYTDSKVSPSPRATSLKSQAETGNPTPQQLSVFVDNGTLKKSFSIGQAGGRREATMLIPLCRRHYLLVARDHEERGSHNIYVRLMGQPPLLLSVTKKQVPAMSREPVQ